MHSAMWCCSGGRGALPCRTGGHRTPAAPLPARRRRVCCSDAAAPAPSHNGSQTAELQATQKLVLVHREEDEDQQVQRGVISSQNSSHTTELPAQHKQQDSTDQQSEVQQLQASVQELMSTVKAQQLALQGQQATIQQLQGTIEQMQAAMTAPVGATWDSKARPFDGQQIASATDRRQSGLFDARFHSTSSTPPDRRVMPDRIILVRHAQSEGNVDMQAYTYIPDPQVPLTALGCRQAHEAGLAIRKHMEEAKQGQPYQLYFYTSPYKRGLQTLEGIRGVFAPHQVAGMQEEVQLREQDFGNFQDAEGKQREKAERLRFGRFFYRFPNGESGADVYDRITVFTDHLIRDINAGRFADGTSLVLITHGLALRIFLMRWFHWKVDEFMDVYNPPNAVPVILEKVPDQDMTSSWAHTKSFYRLSPESVSVLKGLTSEMCRNAHIPPGASSNQSADGSIICHAGYGAVDLPVVGAAAEDGDGDGDGGFRSAADQWAELGGGW